jgi:hypothetical protein
MAARSAPATTSERARQSPIRLVDGAASRDKMGWEGALLMTADEIAI